MLFYCCMNNANKSPVSLRCTFNNCHVLFRYLHSVVHVSFNYRTTSTGCRGCHQQTSVQPYNQPCWCQLDHNCDHQILTSIRVKCWWHRMFFRQRTVTDADHCGGWTQIFGGKAPEMETSKPVAKRNFYLPHLHFVHPWHDSIAKTEIRKATYFEMLRRYFDATSSYSNRLMSCMYRNTLCASWTICGFQWDLDISNRAG